MAVTLGFAAAAWPAYGSQPPEQAAPAADPQEDAEAATEPRLAERLLHEREILGTSFRGHLFIDGLPLSPDGLQIGKALELRRARLSFWRQLPRRWEVLGSAELNSGQFELKDLYTRRRFDRLGTLTVGNQSEPMGLDELTSSLSIPLLEPSLPTALVPGRNFGVMLGNRHGYFQYQLGAFGSGTEQEGRRDIGAALTGRLTHRWLGDGDNVRHLGIALSSRSVSGDEQFRSVPEIGIDQEFTVDTGIINGASRTRRVGLEYLQTFGRHALQGEVIAAHVERDAGTRLRFGGAYLQGTWTAWGEGPRYDEGDAVLARSPVASPAHWGDAWGRGNLAFSIRLSRIDLSDDDIVGGSQMNLTLGATWDISARTRLAANLVRLIDLSGPNAEAEGSTAIGVRFQYAF
ncbi:MAG: hypothetical protein LW860_16945 [Xanthomonadaceae bacterium]|nr:hypothetical protein [Xanthomonadaceae bacterium]